MRQLLILPILLILCLLNGCASYDLQTNKSYDPNSVPFGVYDVYTPKGPLFGLLPDTETHPAVVAIHGGAWMGGNKSDMDDLAELLCSQGYTVLAPNYRLTSDGPWGKGSPWPAQIEDLQKAVEHFRTNAKDLKIDPFRMASMGVSAGGHLATMLAVRPDRVCYNAPTIGVAVDLDGEQDMTKPGNQVMSNFYDTTDASGKVVPGIMTLAIGHPAPWTQAELENISPVFFAPTAMVKPNVLIIHGESDDNVYVANADWIEAALAKNPGKSEVTKIIITGKDGFCHGQCWEVPFARDALIKFLDRHLKR